MGTVKTLRFIGFYPSSSDDAIPPEGYIEELFLYLDTEVLVSSSIYPSSLLFVKWRIIGNMDA